MENQTATKKPETRGKVAEEILTSIRVDEDLTGEKNHRSILQGFVVLWNSSRRQEAETGGILGKISDATH